MKKFTLLALCAFLFTAVRLVAQPTTAPTAPTKAAADVISVLSTAYTPLSTNFTPAALPHAGINFFPDWGQGTTFMEFPIAGDAIKKYATLDYQGIDFAGSINASSMTNLHWDIWTGVATTLRISLVGGSGGGERYVTYVTTAGWNSFDVPLTDYTSQTAFSVGNLIQFKFEEFPMAYRAGTKSVYLYNLYFWKPANVPTLTGFSVPAKLVGDPAFSLTAPTSPSSGAFTYQSSNTGVAMISGSTVTIVGAGTSVITANQAAAGAYAAGSTTATLTVTSPGPQTAAPTPTRLAANVTSLFSNAYTNVGVDTWSAVWDVADVADVTIAGNATKKYTNHQYSGIEFTGANMINATSKTHIHLDVWTADAAGADGFKVKLRDFGANGVFDPAGDDAESIELPFTPTASGWFAIDVPLTSFTGLTTKANLAQLILVTPPSGKTFWLDNVYLYNNPVAGPTSPATAAPTPTRPQANVISIFSNAYADLVGTNWNPGWGQTTVYSDVLIGGNNTKKYENLNYQGAEPIATIDATPATFLHIDAWTANAATSFRVKLVDFGANGVYNAPGTGDDTEHELSFTLPGGSWQALDITLADFTTLAERAHIGQFIISSATSPGPTIWLDNIYFYSNTAIPVELVSFKAKTNNNTTVLSWLTASERDNQGFTIERSADGTTYTAIGNVKGNGTTSAVHNYTFTDATPSNGVNYYRLRQADFNGKESLSKSVSVVFGKNTLAVRSTLVHNTLDVTANDATVTPLSIFNLSGQQVYVGKVQGSQSIDVSALAAGMYIVRTAAGEVGRFVKQ